MARPESANETDAKDKLAWHLRRQKMEKPVTITLTNWDNDHGWEPGTAEEKLVEAAAETGWVIESKVDGVATLKHSGKPTKPLP